jgi:hypothetical protein
MSIKWHATMLHLTTLSNYGYEDLWLYHVVSQTPCVTWGAQTWAHHGRGSSLGPRGPMGGPNLGPSWAGLKFGPSWAHRVPKLRPIMGGAQVWALMGQWGAQTWAHHGRGSSLGPHGPMGGPNLGPSWAGLKFGPSWAHGGPKLGPIMGGAKVWALMGLWGAQTWAHHGRRRCSVCCKM